MPIRLRDLKDEQLRIMNIDLRLREYVVEVPTSEELRPTVYETKLLGDLFDPLFTNPKYFRIKPC